MRVAVVIVNYRTADSVFATLSALANSLQKTVLGSSLGVVVVDNGSGDASYHRIKTWVQDFISTYTQMIRLDIHVVRAQGNYGFGAGNNRGVSEIKVLGWKPEFLYLLNPDAYPTDGAIEALVSTFESNSRLGIVGGGLEDVTAIGEKHRVAFRFPTLFSEFESGMRLGFISKLLSHWIVAPKLPTISTQVDWVSGASMMIRYKAYQELNGFDEAYFLYFEETDFCRRAKKMGWDTAFTPSSRTQHVGSLATGISKTQKKRPAYWFDSRSLYFEKNHSLLYLAACDLTWIVARVSWMLRQRLQGKPRQDPPGLVRDFITHSLKYFSMTKKRKDKKILLSKN